MLLTIHNLNASDFGSYKCVCKNYIGEVDGSITLNGKFITVTEYILTMITVVMTFLLRIYLKDVLFMIRKARRYLFTSLQFISTYSISFCRAGAHDIADILQRSSSRPRSM